MPIAGIRPVALEIGLCGPTLDMLYSVLCEQKKHSQFVCSVGVVGCVWTISQFWNTTALCG